MNAKILILDIETAPAKVLTWNMYNVNHSTDQILSDDYILMWAAKWLGKNKIEYDTVNKRSNPVNYSEKGEKAILKSLWSLLDQADIVVAHNGKDFDIRWINGCFIKHRMPLPSSYIVIDTKIESRKAARYLSHKLEYLAKKFKLPHLKMSTGGLGLWKDCMNGNSTAWGKMVKYCKRDIVVLEEVYQVLKPYMQLHPNLALFHSEDLICPTCESLKIQKKGFFYTRTGTYQRYRCLQCGKNIRSTKRISGSKIVGI